MKRSLVGTMLIGVLFPVAFGLSRAGGSDEVKGMPEPMTTGSGIVVQNFYYAKPGREAAVLRVRLHASDVLRKLGVREGRVFWRVKNKFDVTTVDDPDVMWECEFPDEASVGHDVNPVFPSTTVRFAGVDGARRCWTFMAGRRIQSLP